MKNICDNCGKSIKEVGKLLKREINRRSFSGSLYLCKFCRPKPKKPPRRMFRVTR